MSASADRNSQTRAIVTGGAQGIGFAVAEALADEDEIPTFVMLRRLLLVAWIGSHAETDLAKSMGLPYTEGTGGLCEAYWRKFS